MRVDQGISKYFSVGNITQKKFDDNCGSLALQSEAFCSIRRLASCLVKPIESISIFPSHSLDSACVVEILAKLVIGFSFWERCFLNQVVSSIEVTIAQIVSEKKVEQSALAQFVIPDTTAIISIKELLSEGQIIAFPLFEPDQVVVNEGTMRIECASISTVDLLQQLFYNCLACRKLTISPEKLHQQHFDKGLKLKDLGYFTLKVLPKVEGPCEFSIEALCISKKVLINCQSQVVNNLEQMMPLNDVAVLASLAGEFDSSPEFLIGNSLVNSNEGIFEFWITDELQSKRVCVCGSGAVLAGSGIFFSPSACILKYFQIYLIFIQFNEIQFQLSSAQNISFIIMRGGQAKNQQETKKRNNEIINNLKQTLGKPTIVEAQRTLKILEKLIERIAIVMHLDSEFVMKFNEINNPQKFKLNRTLVQELSPQIQETLINQAKMESEYRTFAQLEQQIKDGEVVEEEKQKEYERVKKDMAYTFKSLIRGLERHPADIEIIKSLKVNSTPNAETMNIHQGLSNYKIIMQKMLATAAEEEQSHTRLIEQLQFRIESLEKTKNTCEKDLLKLREDRAKHAEDKKEEMDKLKSQIREVKSNKERQMEEIAKRGKQMSDTLARDFKKEEDSLKTMITQERNKLTKMREENAKNQTKSKNDKLTNEAHLMEMISNYDAEMFKLSSSKSAAQTELKKIEDQLNNLKRHFLEIEEQRKREEALLEADRKRKHQWDLLEQKKGEACTKIKQAYRLFKAKKKKKTKKKK